MAHRTVTVAFLFLLAGATAAARAQHCPNQGTQLRAATVESGPALGCAGASAAPSWHLLVPPHRAVVPKVGFRQGDARAVPRLLVRYRCTGWLLFPVALDGVAVSGYVLDVDEAPCPPPPD